MLRKAEIFEIIITAVDGPSKNILENNKLDCRFMRTGSDFFPAVNSTGKGIFAGVDNKQEIGIKHPLAHFYLGKLPK